MNITFFFIGAERSEFQQLDKTKKPINESKTCNSSEEKHSRISRVDNEKTVKNSFNYIFDSKRYSEHDDRVERNSNALSSNSRYSESNSNRSDRCYQNYARSPHSYRNFDKESEKNNYISHNDSSNIKIHSNSKQDNSYEYSNNKNSGKYASDFCQSTDFRSNKSNEQSPKPSFNSTQHSNSYNGNWGGNSGKQYSNDTQNSKYHGTNRVSGYEKSFKSQDDLEKSTSHNNLNAEDNLQEVEIIAELSELEISHQRSCVVDSDDQKILISVKNDISTSGSVSNTISSVLSDEVSSDTSTVSNLTKCDTTQKTSISNENKKYPSDPHTLKISSLNTGKNNLPVSGILNNSSSLQSRDAFSETFDVSNCDSMQMLLAPSNEDFIPPPVACQPADAINSCSEKDDSLAVDVRNFFF